MTVKSLHRLSGYSMSPETWKQNIQQFLSPHPAWYEAGEDVHVPRENLTVAFLFDGGLRVVGDSASLEVNYNHPDMLILGVRGPDGDRIYRMPWDRLVCFELIRHHPPESGPTGPHLRPKRD